MDKISDIKLLIGILLEKNLSYIREIQTILNIPKSTISDKLKELYKDNIIDFEIKGRNKLFFFKNSFEAKQYLRFIEIYKLEILIKNYPNLKSIINSIQEKIDNELVLIFGSYSKNQADSSSDIDIFIQTNSRKLKEEIKFINSKISVKIGDLNKKTNLNQEIKKDGVVIHGIDEFLKIKNE